MTESRTRDTIDLDAAFLDECERANERERAREAAEERREKRRPNRALSDAGNAERLVDRHGVRLRHVGEFSRSPKSSAGWLHYDGCRWVRDTTGELIRCAVETARSVYEERLTASDDERKAVVRHALNSEKASRIEAMIELATADPRVAIRASDLDLDPFFLCVGNGVLDLRTGELLDHDPTYLMTRMTRVEYNPEAACEEWETFIRRALPDDDVRRFAQRFVGYAATADTREDTVVLVHGPAATGKSTFLQAVTAALGDYAQTATFDTFLRRDRATGPRDDIAHMLGARLIVASESEDGRTFSAATLKALSGGDVVRCRHLFGREFEFRPTAKVMLASNYRPRVGADDDAAWRRLRELPFTTVVPEAERDPGLRLRLQDPRYAGPAVLRWIAEGTRAWLADGLGAPQAVREATDDYRRSCDPFATWFEDELTFDPEGKTFTPAADLYASYLRWAGENHVRRPASQKALGLALASHGCTQDRVRSNGKLRRFWVGVTTDAGARLPT